MAARRSRSSGVSRSASASAPRLALTCSGRVAPNRTVVTEGSSSANAIARLAGSAPISLARAARSRPAATADAHCGWSSVPAARPAPGSSSYLPRSEEHTSELQSPYDLVCRLLLEKKKKKKQQNIIKKKKKQKQKK